MLKILHKGIQPSMALDTSELSGVLEADVVLPYILNLKGGRLISMDSDGNAQLADGDPAAGLEAIGFLINDAAGYFYENKPAFASGKLSHTFGNTVVITDQIDPDVTFVPGEKLYAGTGAKIGLVTNVPPSTLTLAEGTPNTVATVASKSIGIAGSSASSASPELTVLV